jgi:lipopolysaccharide/colanic/teichoic acid biosynthesis glycosyltransferase
MPCCCADYSHFWKRGFDLLAALIGIILISPLLLLVALIVKIGSAGPVLYCQQRIGRDFKPFSIYKFRTMRPGSDADGNTCTVQGDSRITPIGRLLRKTKLDELPQLFNVLKGEMSLVGPRPEVARYVELFREDYKTVLSVRPGITDYAAIEYRDEEGVLNALVGGKYASVHEAYIAEVLPAKIQLYKKYIAEQFFLPDLGIIFKTLLKGVGK